MQSTSQTSVFCVSIQRLNQQSKQKNSQRFCKKIGILTFLWTLASQTKGTKKIKHVNMNLIAKYNTVSTYTAQRGIYILIKKNLGTIENVQTLGNSTIFFDIKNNDNKKLTIAAIYAP